jgi:hypothetical protein
VRWAATHLLRRPAVLPSLYELTSPLSRLALGSAACAEVFFQVSDLGALFLIDQSNWLQGAINNN